MKTVCYPRVKIALLAAVAMLIAVLFFATGCASSRKTEEEADGHLILNCTFDYMQTGEKRRYYVKQSPASAGYDLVWESGDEEIATVDKDGVVTARGAGETTVTVRAEGTPYKSRMKLIVAEQIINGSEGENAAQLAVDNAKNDGSVLIIGGYYPSVRINKKLTVTCAEGAAFGEITLEDDAQLFLYHASVSAPATTEKSACVTLGKNTSFTAVACSFSYIDPTGETFSETAVSAPTDAERVYCRGCSFSGYRTCVKVGATEGEIYLVNNDFTDAETAVEIDLRVKGTTEDKDASGKIADNVYVGCKTAVSLYYNALSYTGALEIADADVSVPS